MGAWEQVNSPLIIIIESRVFNLPSQHWLSSIGTKDDREGRNRKKNVLILTIHLFSLKEVEEQICHFHLLILLCNFFPSHDTSPCGVEDTKGSHTQQGHDKEALHPLKREVCNCCISLIVELFYTLSLSNCCSIAQNIYNA